MMKNIYNYNKNKGIIYSYGKYLRIRQEITNEKLIDNKEIQKDYIDFCNRWGFTNEISWRKLI
jgi:hypothetical protein